MKIDTIERTVQKTHVWLNEIANDLETKDERESYHALRAVLHAIRDRLSVEEASALGAQLPLLVRGIFYEGWHAAGKPVRLRKAEDFLELVAQNLAHDAEVRIEPEDAIKAVFGALKTHADKGAVEKVVHNMPPEIQALFVPPESAEH